MNKDWGAQSGWFLSSCLCLDSDSLGIDFILVGCFLTLYVNTSL